MPSYNAERIAVQRAFEAQARRGRHKRLYRSLGEMPQHLHPSRIRRRRSEGPFLAYSVPLTETMLYMFLTAAIWSLDLPAFAVINPPYLAFNQS